MILLDEPLSNLDAQLRLTMRAEFKALQRRLELTAIYVTHDQEEAWCCPIDLVMRWHDRAGGNAGGNPRLAEVPLRRRARRRQHILPCDVAGPQDAAIAMLAGGVRLPVRTNGMRGSAWVCFRPINVRISATPGAFGQPATVTALSYLGDLMR